MALQQALYLKELGVPIPTEYILENMQLPNKDELIQKIIQQEGEQREQQQQMAQLQMQQLQVDNETKLSYAEGQKALAAERINKTRLDAALSAERMQRADEDRTGAFLNLVKAVKEIENMDVEQIAQAVQIMKTTQEMHGMNQEMQQPMAPQPISQEQPQSQQAPSQNVPETASVG